MGIGRIIVNNISDACGLIEFLYVIGELTCKNFFFFLDIVTFIFAVQESANKSHYDACCPLRMAWSRDCISSRFLFPLR